MAKSAVNRKLIGLAALVAVLTVYAVYDYKISEKEKVTKAEQAKLLTLNRDQINEIEIDKKEGRVLLKRTPDGWRLEEPIQDWADNEGLDIFISTAIDEKAEDVVAEGDKIDWANFGLAKPLGQVVFRSSSGESASFEVSSKRNFEQNVFLRRNHENRVLVGAGAWLARLNKGVTEFRDKRLLRHKIASVEKADIQLAKNHLVIELKDGQWILSSQASKKLDQNKVRELLQSINDTTIADFYIEGREPNKAEQTRYFLDKPFAEIKLKLGDKNWRAVIGKAPNNLIFAWTSDPLFVSKIEPGTLDKVFNANEESLIEKPPEIKADTGATGNPAMKLNSQNLPEKQEKK